MCRSTHDLWTRLLPVGRLPGPAAPSKTLPLFSIPSPLNFCPLTSQSGLQAARGACSTHRARSCRNHELSTAWGPTPRAESPLPTSTASPRLWRGCGNIGATQPARAQISQGPSGWRGSDNFGTAPRSRGVRSGLQGGGHPLPARPGGNCEPRTAEGSRRPLSISIPREGEKHPRKHEERR